MAKPRRIPVELSDFLSDLDPVAMKGLVSAPIAYRADRLIAAVPRSAGKVTQGELVSALLHATAPDSGTLATMIDNYRNDKVYETRVSLGELTEQSGPWEIEIRAPGQRIT